MPGETTPGVRHRPLWLILFFTVHAFLTWRLLVLWWMPPVFLVEMSSTSSSVAQVYYDTGAGINEAESVTVPVHASPESRTLRFRLPNASIKALRFDPLAGPGSVVVRGVTILRSSGSAAALLSPAQIHAASGIDREEHTTDGARFHVPEGGNDPQLRLDLPAPLRLQSRWPGPAVFFRTAVWNGLLLVPEAVILLALRQRRHVRARVVFAAASGLVAVHLFLSWALLSYYSSPPVLFVRMSSTAVSRAQVYWDTGAGMSETQSSSLPVYGAGQIENLRLPLPAATVRALRFDPLNSPGSVFLASVEILRSDGSVAATFPPSHIHGVLGFDKEEISPYGVRYHIRDDSLDPQFALDLDSPVDLQSRFPGAAVLLRIAFWNALLLSIEAIAFLWAPAIRAIVSMVRLLDARAAALAGHISSDRFIVFDRAAIWFYGIAALFFLILAAACLNGSSMGIFWNNYKVGAPARVIAGVPQGIRADEFNYQTPGMLNQTFREHRFELERTASGGRSVGLLAEVPVRHVTTWFRPQFWPFFALPAGYAFAAWWQAKSFLMIVGVFTLLLLLTRSTFLAASGALWLFFSQFTQWCFSWPSMLPEMAGVFCLTLVFALYLTVGRNPLALFLAALGGASCAINFALCAYVPHQIPYFWAGVFIGAAWCMAHRQVIFSAPAARLRAISVGVFVSLTALLLFTVVHDAGGAIQGIAGTTYPGHRSLNGGGFSLAALGTHFLAASESDTHFPPEYSNINEASGFLWLAPITLLCFAKMRALPRERQILLGGLWTAALLLLCWMLLPVPAALGALLSLDRVQAVRALPALGMLNIAIVMLVFSSPDRSRRLPLAVKCLLAAGIFYGLLLLANHGVRNYFHPSELLAASLWAALLAGLLLDSRPRAFAAASVLPGIILFGLINPVQRGIGTITSSTLFELVHKDTRLLRGKWLVFGEGFPASIFTATGCDVYNGMRYLPDLEHFPVLKAHGVDTNILNSLGYVDIRELPTGVPPAARPGPYGPILSLSALDPLVKELGIRYIAFHERPGGEILAHLKPLTNGTISEFWLYELR